MQPVMIVTGGSRGIGAATARLAAARGYRVALSYRDNREAADAVVTEIARSGGEAIAVAADVSCERDVARLFDSVDRALGPVAVLVNNAGILERQCRVEAMDAARLARVLARKGAAMRGLQTAHGRCEAAESLYEQARQARAEQQEKARIALEQSLFFLSRGNGAARRRGDRG